jgi:hypothetical protein
VTVGGWRAAALGVCGVAALILVVGNGGSEATGKDGKSSRTKIDRIAIADVPFESGGKRIGVEVSAGYRPDLTGSGAAAFRHRLVARVRAIVGGEKFSADPEPNARLNNLLLDQRRLLIEHHLFFSRSESRRIRRGLRGKQALFSAVTTYSVDRDQDGESDSTAQDRLQDDSPNQVTPPDTGGGTDIGQESNPCSRAQNKSVCRNVPSDPKTTTHFWDTVTLRPACPIGTFVIIYETGMSGGGEFPYRINSNPANLDRHTTNVMDRPTLYVTDDNLHHPVRWTATYACTPNGR